MEDHGGNIYDKDIRIDFSVNVNPFGMPEAVKGAAIRGVEESFRYPDPEQRKLRQAISAAFCIPAERIVAGSGAAELGEGSRLRPLLRGVRGSSSGTGLPGGAVLSGRRK